MSTNNGPRNSPNSSPRARKSYSSPKSAKRIHSSADHSKHLFAPKPYKKDSLMNKTLSKPGLSQASSRSPKSQHINTPQKVSIGSKPVVPPKPRHVIVKREHSAKFKTQKSKEDNNDSGLSGKSSSNHK